MDIINKVILITGGTSGIGRATAVLLVKEGANVVIFGRHQNKLNDALSDIKRLSGRSAYGLTADVSKQEDIGKVFDFIDQKWGRIDVLINNAALPARSILDADLTEIQTVTNVNIRGYLIASKFALKTMIKNKFGHIVNISSLSAEYKEKDADLYVATKAAISGFNDSLRKKVNHYGVKVTLIEPGSTGTDMVSENSYVQHEMELQEQLLKAEDVAESILFTLKQPSRVLIQKIEVRANKQYL